MKPLRFLKYATTTLLVETTTFFDDLLFRLLLQELG